VIWVAVGGRGTLVGAMIGAVLVNFGKTWLTGSFPDFWLFFLGGLFVLVTLAMPKGIVGIYRQVMGIRRRPTLPPVAQEGTP
jgi:urea transport system permease protein